MEYRRLFRGFGYGVTATIVMSMLVVLGGRSGLSPIPEPIPKAIVTAVLGVSEPKPIGIGLAVGLHLAYGGAFGAVLADRVRPVTAAKGALLGIVLWVVMGLIVLPVLGWGIFGTTITPKIAVATFFLHLVYGTVLGGVLDRTPNEKRATSTGTD